MPPKTFKVCFHMTINCDFYDYNINYDIKYHDIFIYFFHHCIEFNTIIYSGTYNVSLSHTRIMILSVICQS